MCSSDLALLGDGPHRNVEALVVVGGDGMVHLGLDVVAQTDVPMGIIATGTGNDVARHFGLPARDVEAAADIIDAALRGQGRIEACDAIHVTRPDGTRVPDEHECSTKEIIEHGSDKVYKYELTYGKHILTFASGRQIGRASCRERV